MTLFTRTALTTILLVGLVAVLLSGCTAAGTATTRTSTSMATTTTSTPTNTATTTATSTATTTTSTTAGSNTGTVAVYVTDAPPDEEITAVLVTVSGLRVHKAEAEREQQQDGTVNATQEQEQQDGDGGEWIDIPITGNMTTFDLLQVKDVTAFFGSANVSAGRYTQVRLVVDSARVSTADNVTRDATVSGGEVKIVRPFDIVAGETTELLLDFDAEHSVNFTGNGKVMIKPVIKLSIDAKHQSGQPDEQEPDDDEETPDEECYCFNVSCEEFQATSAMTGNITVPLGETLTVTLCSNATTGYEWDENAVIGDNVTLAQTSHEYIEPDNGNGNGQVGTAGTEQWTFNTLAAGTTTIYFEYSQPWEGGDKAAWTLVLSVTVE